MTLSMSALADRTVDEVAIRLRRLLTVSHPARTATFPEQSAASVENASNH
jgi:hypothetical protein